MLRSLGLKLVYDSETDDLINDLFAPLLSESMVYRRGVGYFTSGWLRLALDGLVPFAERGGKAYFITSPNLEEKDWQALQLGHEANRSELLYSILKERILDLETSLKQDTRTALAWLVADGILEFKFAIPKNRVGDFHDKFAVCDDTHGDQVAIHGSYNDSIHGTLNGESFSVFRSWEPGQQGYVVSHLERFQKIWAGHTDFYDIYDMGEAIQGEIAKLRGTRDRPYKMPLRSNLPVIGVPNGLRLHDFQQRAVADWLAQDGQGLFEMATGAGKTFTSLAAATALQKNVGKLAVIVAAPFNHLVDQWREDVVRFGFTPVLCRDDSADWVPTVRSRIQDFNAGTRRSLFFITTHKTSCSTSFTNLLLRLKGNVLFIADEVHYLGSGQYRKALLENYKFRLGLSATPERWFDEEGTAVLRNFFGPTVAEMPLEKAIGRFLTPYRFVPHPVQLTEDEMDEFTRLTNQIRTLMQRKSQDEESPLLDSLLRRRAAIVAKAENKFPLFKRLIENKIREVGREGVHHTIVYCAPGETGEGVRILASLGIRAHEFVYSVPNEERVRLLQQFDEGDIQVLVAIKCLDEGVNIPATREAYFIASTSNPREFVQRRGRILRKHPGKTEAVLHDLVVVPPARDGATPADMLEDDKVLLRKEMPRFAEFASAALNEMQARSVLFPILHKYDLLTLFDKTPWDVYRENSARGDDDGYTHS